MHPVRPLLLAALLLAGCRGDAPAREEARASITGRWTAEEDDVEFFDNGRLLLRRGAFRGVGRYEWVEADRVLMTYEGTLAGTVPGDYRVRLAGDSLALCETDRPARCIGYRRHEAPAVPDTAGARPRLDARGRPEDPPRLAQLPADYQSPPQARAAEAQPVLKQAYVLQTVHHAENGAFAPSMEALAEVGWQAPVLRHYHPPRVVRATGDRLCIVMEPRAADLWPQHVDETGELGRGDACP